MFIAKLASIIILLGVLIGSSFLNLGLTSNFFSFHQPEIIKISELLGTAGEARGEGGASFINSLPIAGSENKLPLSDERPVKTEIAKYDLQSNCGVVLDAESGEILFNKDGEKQWPIASITKLATALIFLEYNPGWDAVYIIKDDDRKEGGRINVFRGEKIKVKDLFNLSLIGSDNTATIALVHSTGMSEDDFVKKMNAKATELGLKNTKFFDAVGLSNNNVSTARETGELVKAALSKEEIKEATLRKKYDFVSLDNRRKIVYNTDDLLDIFPQNGVKIIGGKTGYTEAAGYCFAGKFFDKTGREIISVILGSGSNDSRFSETRDLVEWAYKSFVW
jgi:D-alanyl-D-alanine carboxypeptidase